MTELRAALRAAALVTPIYLAASAVPPGGLFRGREYRDVGLYGEHAQRFLDGQIPYRDFFVEYPPGAFLAWLPPALLPDDAYRHAFKAFMAAVGVASLVVAALILLRLGAQRMRLHGALAALALAPLVLGPVALNTYDVLPATLVGGAVCALLYSRPALAFALLGLAATAKVFPAALLPVFCLAVPARALAGPLIAFGAAVGAVVGPFALLGWSGLRESFAAQAGRGLQVESLGGAALGVADRIGLYDAAVVTGSPARSIDFDGSLAGALALATSVAQVLAIAVLVWVFARGARGGERLVAATAGTIAAVLAFSRFISPQYLVWLIPVVVLVMPPWGVAAAALAGLAMLLGRLWFFHYRDVFEQDAVVWLVLVRDLALAVLYAVLVAAVLRLRTKTPSSSSTFLHNGLERSRASGTAAVEAADRRSR